MQNSRKPKNRPISDRERWRNLCDALAEDALDISPPRSDRRFPSPSKEEWRRLCNYATEIALERAIPISLNTRDTDQIAEIDLLMEAMVKDEDARRASEAAKKKLLPPIEKVRPTRKRPGS